MIGGISRLLLRILRVPRLWMWRGIGSVPVPLLSIT
nr:MAG TPA: hypothetical protein [Caudoviricetes sp.]